MLDRDLSISKCYLIPGWCWPVELGAIYDLIKEAAPRVHVEIGSFCGRSLFVSAMALPEEAKLYSVEPFIALGPLDGHLPSMTWWMRTYQATLADIATYRPDLKLRHIKASSVDAARDMPEKADSVYLDGNHEYAEVLADIEVWRASLNPGGLLFGHDYTSADPGVVDAVNEKLEGGFEVISNTRIWVSPRL